MQHLIDMLKASHQCWGLNVGGNEFLSTKMWRALAEALPNTQITHGYVGTEASVTGALQREMNARICENRKKHNLHCDPSNAEVAMEIRHM